MKILNTNRDIQNKILEAIRAKSARKFIKLANDQYKDFIQKSREIINRNIIASKTYKSLQAGILKRDFGLDDATFAAFNKNINNLYNCSYAINESPQNKNTIIALSFDISELEEGNAKIESAIAATSYESNNNKIEWLRWLLYGGGGVIIKNWKVLPKDGAGRSKMGVMITLKKEIDKNGKTIEDYTFSVSRAYSGRHGNNFVSRAIGQSLEEIKQILPVSKK